MNLDSAVDAIAGMIRMISDESSSDEEVREQATQLVAMVGQAVVASTALVSSMAENTTHFTAVAKLVRAQYQALKKEGFSGDDALSLCAGIVSGLTVPNK